MSFFSHHTSIHSTNLFCISVAFLTFLEIIKHDIKKILLFSSIFNVKIATQKFTHFDGLKKKNMCADMIAAKKQSNQIVSNEVKES